MGALLSGRFNGVVLLVLAGLICAWTATPSSQTPPERSNQRFRAGIEIVRLNVTAVGEDGREIPDLMAADFEVKIDGTPREVRFARRTGMRSGSAASGAPTAMFPGSYATNTRAVPGRAIMFVVDLDSIRAGSERTILDTAARLIDALGPNDAVGLVPIPGASLTLTRDHARVSAAVRALYGTNHGPLVRHAFTIDEAVEFDRAGKLTDLGEIKGGNQVVIRRVIERECRTDEVRRRQTDEGTIVSALCPPEILREARERLTYERLHVLSVLDGVSSIAERLHVDAPRTIVLLSGGLIFEQESQTAFRRTARALKQANVTLYAVHVDQPAPDASVTLSAEMQAYSSRDRQSGLANLATMAGGAFYSGVGTAAGVFERLKTEMSSTYELGVEALEQDSRQPSLEVEVAVKRTGVKLRYRSEAIFEPAAEPTGKVADLITQSIEVPDLPIHAAVYTVRGEETDTVRVLFMAELGRAITLVDPVQYAVRVTAGGKTTLETRGTAARAGDIARVQFAAQLAPARYVVRIAAADSTGRGGSLDVPVTVGLRAAGTMQVSDLILGQSGATFAPSIHAPAGQPLGTYIEVYSADPARFADTDVRFELRRSAEAPVLAAARGTLQPTGLDRRQIAEGSISGADLLPGEYTLSAIVTLAGAPVGKVSRSIIVTEPVVAAAAPAEPPPVLPAVPVHVNVAKGSDPALADAITKMGTYVASYGEKAGLIVAVEQYTQYEEPYPPRHITAEFALVKTSNAIGWTGFRDVVEVNGSPVSDRRDRLMRLFTQSASPIPEAIRIANESTRFNVGPVSRNFNVPTTTLFFFHPANISRFTFQRKGTKKIDGVETWEIEFVETRRPTMIGTRAGKDIPCRGTLWVVPSDGTVVRTRLQLRNFADALSMSDSAGAPLPSPADFQSPIPASRAVPAAPAGGGATAPGSGSPGQPSGGTPSGGSTGQGGTSGGASGGASGAGSTAGATGGGVRARPRARFDDMIMTTLESRADIEVTFKRDPQLSIWVPTRMSEEYEGTIPRVSRRPISGTARSIATYSEFRQFETSAKIVAPKE